jgi:hypothetical protein
VVVGASVVVVVAGSVVVVVAGTVVDVVSFGVQDAMPSLPSVCDQESAGPAQLIDNDSPPLSRRTPAFCRPPDNAIAPDAVTKRAPTNTPAAPALTDFRDGFIENYPLLRSGLEMFHLSHSGAEYRLYRDNCYRHTRRICNLFACYRA